VIKKNGLHNKIYCDEFTYQYVSVLCQLYIQSGGCDTQYILHTDTILDEYIFANNMLLVHGV